MTKWFEEPALRFAVGVEDTFVPQTRVGDRALDEYELTQHYHHWHSDLGLAAESGASMIRWGVPWYRVQPEPDVWDFSWLDQVVDRLVELGLEPIVDLMHYGTPLWLDNEFVNASYPQAVAAYGAKVAERYRGRLNVFTPLNEPLLNAVYCGEFGVWPPHLRGDDGLVKLIKAISQGIVLTQQAIKEVSPEATFVNVEASFRFGGAVEEHAEEVAHLRRRAYVVADLTTGRVGDDHPLREWLLRHGFTEQDLAWARENAQLPDVMGVNYYPDITTERFVAASEPQPTGGPRDIRPRMDEGAEGLEEVLRAWAERYGCPVMLTETAKSGEPDEQIRWLHTSLDTVRNLRSEGVRVVGYTWWAVIDWMGWDYRYETSAPEHHLQHLGLWRLDPDGAGVLRRTRTPLADAFRACARPRP